jgi:hypothetical protein
VETATIEKLITLVEMTGVTTAEAQQKALAKGFDGIGKSAQGADKDVKGLAKGIAAGAGIAAAGAGMFGFMNSAVKDYAQAERVQIQFNQSLKANLNLSGAAAESMSRYAETYAAMAGLSPYSKEDIENAMAMLATFHMTSEQIKEYTPRVLDMAAGLKAAGREEMCLKEIAIALGKAHQGNITGLRRVGVMVDQNAYKTRGYKAIIEELDHEFKGQSKAAMSGAAGDAIALEDTMHELSITMGQDVAPAMHDLHLVLTPLVRDLKWLDEHSGGWGGKILGAAALAAMAVGPILSVVNGLGMLKILFGGGAAASAAVSAASATAAGGAAVAGGAAATAAGAGSAIVPVVSGGAIVPAAGSGAVAAGGGIMAALTAGIVAYTGAEALDWFLGSGTGQMNKRLGNGGWLPNFSPTRAIIEGAGAYRDVQKARGADDAVEEQRMYSADRLARFNMNKMPGSEPELTVTNKLLSAILANQTKTTIVGGGARTAGALTDGDKQRIALRTLTAAVT